MDADSWISKNVLDVVRPCPLLRNDPEGVTYASVHDRRMPGQPTFPTPSLNDAKHRMHSSREHKTPYRSIQYVMLNEPNESNFSTKHLRHTRYRMVTSGWLSHLTVVQSSCPALADLNQPTAKRTMYSRCGESNTW
jgi:hypothetical protein